MFLSEPEIENHASVEATFSVPANRLCKLACRLRELAVSRIDLPEEQGRFVASEDFIARV